jgi:hypothetical protein
LARLYTDNNISLEAHRHLRLSGHEVTSCVELGLRDAEDHVHLFEASVRDAIMLTHDKGFGLWNRAWQFWSAGWNAAASHAGILVIPQERIWPPSRSVAEIGRFLATNPGLINACYLAHPNGYWQRQ